MSATRTLPEMDEIKKICTAYTRTLTSQFKLKKLIISITNKLRSYLDSTNNIYIQNDHEQVKIQTLAGFEGSIRKALALGNSVPKLIKLVEEINDEYKLSEDTQYVNFSKYRITLKAVISYIVSKIKYFPEFQEFLNPLKKELADKNAQLNKAYQNGFDKKADAKLIAQRNELAYRLANFGDIEVIKASVNDYGLFDKLIKPHKSFRPITRYDSELSTPVDIHYDIPWILQPLLHVIFFYRINKHDYPPDLSEWTAFLEKYNKEKNSEEGVDNNLKQSTSSDSIAESKETERKINTSNKKEAPKGKKEAKNNKVVTEPKGEASSAASILAQLPIIKNTNQPDQQLLKFVPHPPTDMPLSTPEERKKSGKKKDAASEAEMIESSTSLKV